MTRGFWSILAVASLACPPVTSHAETYHVSVTGDDGGDGSVSNPFRTIGRAVEAVGPGDIVLVAAGTYYERLTLTLSGSSSGPITIEGERGSGGQWLTVIDGSDPAGSWEPAPEVGPGVFKTSDIPYKPYSLVTGEGWNIARIHDDNMESSRWIDGFGLLALPADEVFESHCSDGSLFASVPYWDGVGAYFGYMDGVTYVRFRDGDDPSSMGLRSSWGPDRFGGWPKGAALYLNGASYLVIRNFLIQGSRFAIEIRGSGAHHNVIENNHLMNGHGRVVIYDGASENVVRNNVLELNQIGFDGRVPGPFTRCGPCDPAFYPDPEMLAVRSHFYRIFKYTVASSNEADGDCGVCLFLAGPSNEIHNNTIFNGAVGVSLYETDGTKVYRNEIHNMACEGIWVLVGVEQTEVFDNVIHDCNIGIRPQCMEGGWGECGSDRGRSVYIYRNMLYSPPYEGELMYFHFWPESPPPAVYPEFYVYHNSFSGSGWPIGIGDALPAGGMPGVRFIDNVFSSPELYTSWVPSAFITDSSMVASCDYNWAGGDYQHGVPAWFGENNIEAEGEQVWPLDSMPDFLLPEGSPAREAGVDLSQEFTVQGEVHAALPGMVPGYFTGLRPDLGAIQSGMAPPCVGPVGEEVCGNGLDDDCDGETDEVDCTGEVDAESEAEERVENDAAADPDMDGEPRADVDAVVDAEQDPEAEEEGGGGCGCMIAA